MLKVKIEKQTDNGIEFVIDTELQEKPSIGEKLKIDGILYTVKKIIQSTDCFIITVKDISKTNFKGLQYL